MRTHFTAATQGEVVVDSSVGSFRIYPNAEIRAHKCTRLTYSAQSPVVCMPDLSALPDNYYFCTKCNFMSHQANIFFSYSFPRCKVFGVDTPKSTLFRIHLININSVYERNLNNSKYYRQDQTLYELNSFR